MLTTASITFSATSAMPSGPRASAGTEDRRGQQDAGGAKADRGQHGTQAMAQGWNRTGHISSLSSQIGRNLKSTVRPNGVAAQAFEPDIPLT